MLEFHDYSGRRGALVPLLSKMHAMFTENATKDTTAGIAPPEHFVTWRQKAGNRLLDINRRFLIAYDGGNLSGVMIYLYDGEDVYIEELQIGWIYRNNPHVLEGLLKKLEFDVGLKEVTFFASDRVKLDSDKEKLAAVGLNDTHKDGWEKLGSLSQTTAAMKARYNRGNA